MTGRKTVQIQVHPWFRDHYFNGQSIFPAVESMLLLAEIAKEIRPDIQRTVMNRAVFSKFLPIPDDATELSVLVDIDENENELCLKLLSRIQFKKISRVKEHAEICFPVKTPEVQTVPKITAAKKFIAIEASRIYEELVPFGKTYRSLTGVLRISDNMACGTLLAAKPATQHRMELELGSPFPLDGAMHAACVLGQCIADFVPFPVGFTARYINKPTQAGKEYSTTVLTKSVTKDELLFDLSIYDEAGTVYETVKGLRMRDVSGGAVKPPGNLPKITTSPL